MSNANSTPNSVSYVFAAVICFVLASAVYLIALPTENTSPPTPEPTSGLPEGHPTPSGNPAASGSDVPAPGLEQLETRMKDLETSLANNPDNDQNRLALANALYDHGQIGGSMESFRRAQELYTEFLEKNPNDAGARTDRAYTIYRMGDLQGAITELQKVRAIDPKHQQATFNLGIMFKELDQPDSVLHYMAVTAEIDSTSRVGQAALQVLGAYQESHAH